MHPLLCKGPASHSTTAGFGKHISKHTGVLAAQTLSLRITFFLEREPRSETAESALSIRASSSDRLHSREDRNPKMLGAVKGTPGVHQDSPARVRMHICNMYSSLNIY